MAKTPKNKTDILQELESIQRLLLEDGIPILEAEIRMPTEFTPTTPSHSAPQLQAPPPLSQPPHQSSLFDETASDNSPPEISAIPSRSTHYPPLHPDTTSPLRGKGENPFLPQHIRERLQGNPFSKKSVRQANEHNASTINEQPRPYSLDTIIDEIVADTLPRIEAKLRAKLSDIAPEEIETLIKLSEDT
jgi:hypothetical protein